MVVNIWIDRLSLRVGLIWVRDTQEGHVTSVEFLHDNKLACICQANPKVLRKNGKVDRVAHAPI